MSEKLKQKPPKHFNESYFSVGETKIFKQQYKWLPLYMSVHKCICIWTHIHKQETNSSCLILYISCKVWLIPNIQHWSTNTHRHAHTRPHTHTHTHTHTIKLRLLSWMSGQVRAMAAAYSTYTHDRQTSSPTHSSRKSFTQRPSAAFIHML